MLAIFFKNYYFYTDMFTDIVLHVCLSHLNKDYYYYY